MNFIKNKDVKRASYYVWFLGAKESKGLRGDEYVQPVLNFLLDNDCDLEPSKVTLQVSGKGLKIIQILNIPRKSSKSLNADQQLQLFTNGKSGDSGASSLMKSEQVKHHIPHDSISWIYQEDDIICAILLLYNPITRCPVHVHAYRCDSIQTANNLRQQLQTLVDRPENQKKFREIESRLAAKGLLILPPPPSSHSPLNGVYHPHNGHSSSFDDDILPSSRHYEHHLDGKNHPHHHRSFQNQSPSASKTLNSDGRSTRTDGSDEMNSEESNSSDLGYAIRSNHMRNGDSYMKMESSKSSQDLYNRKNNKSRKYSQDSKNIPNTLIVDDNEPQSNLYDSLAAELRAKLGNPKMGPLLLPPRDYDSQKSNGNKQKESGVAKKSRSHKDLNKLCHPLSRSESSGKCSSGIGSDEALCNNNDNNNQKSSNQQQRPPAPRSYYFDSPSSKPLSKQQTTQMPLSSSYHNQFDETINDDISSNADSSDVEIDLHHRRLFHGSIDCLEVDVEDFEEDVLFTTTVPTSTTKQQSNHKSSSKTRSKSSFDLANSHRNDDNDFDIRQPMSQQQHVPKQQFYRPQKQHLLNSMNVVDHHFRGNRDDDMLNTDESYNNKIRLFSTSNPNLEPTRHPLKEVNSSRPSKQKLNEKSIINSKQQTTSMQLPHPMPSSSVIGRREQRFNGTSAAHHNNNSNKIHRNENHENQQPRASASKKMLPTQKFYFADAEFSSSSAATKDHRNYHSNNKYGNHRDRSMGRLDQQNDMDNGYGPMSLNFNHYPDTNDRSISPLYLQQQLPKHSSSSSASSRNYLQNKSSSKEKIKQPFMERELRLRSTRDLLPSSSASRDNKRMFDKPFSRYSYIDTTNYDLEEERDERVHSPITRYNNMIMSNNLMMIRNKR